ncbi:MAG: hypothetical protein LBQ83_00985 [Candidatus Margulisbacteria bacterium]|jgi:hypothetical protein|nr:hypothetical protein [Candidatus Margulisiibacteriota bacterium]
MKKYLACLLLFTLALAAQTTLTELDGAFSSPRSAALGMAGAADRSAADIFHQQFGLAGLAEEGFYVSSYQLFTDTQYLNGALYFPLGGVGLGLGYRRRSVSDVLFTPPDLLDASGRPDAGRVERLAYQQNALYLAAGYTLEHFPGLQALDLGLAYKSYTVNNSSAELSDLAAQGSNIDLGFLARVNELWWVSLLGRNIIEGSGMNGALVWRSGTSERLVRSVVLGNRLALNGGRLLLFLDANYYAEDYAPLLLNAGAEGKINSFLTLRGGLRQYAQLTGGAQRRVFSAVSAGLGLTPWRGVALDYAYYPGDALALEAVHYAGFGLNIGELTSGAVRENIPAEEDPAPESLQIQHPADYFVTNAAALSCALRIQGYPSLNINGAVYTLDPQDKKTFTVSLNLEAGANTVQFSAGDRTVKRRVLRLRDWAELRAAGLEKDLTQTVFTPAGQEDFTDSILRLEDFAAYAVQTLNLRLPQDFSGIFNDLDILYFNGFLGKTSEGLLQLGAGHFTLGRLAEILARIDGYADVLAAAEDAQAKAVEILTMTGYYTAADFMPQDGEVTLAKAQSLLLRTAAVHKRLEQEFGGYPLVWLDCAERDNGKATLRLYNAERFVRYEWTYGKQSVSAAVDAEGYAAVEIAPDVTESGALTVNVYAKPGSVWQFQTGLTPRAQDVLLLARIEPQNPEAGMTLKVNFAVLAGLRAESVELRADFLTEPLILRRLTPGLWQTDLRLPDTLRNGEYALDFTVNAAQRSYAKQYPMQVRGPAAAPQPVPRARAIGRRVVTRVSAEKVRSGEALYIYAGVTAGGSPVAEMRIVRPDQPDILAVRYNEQIWRTHLTGFTAGRNEYKAVAVFQDGTAAERAGAFWCDDPVTVPPPVKPAAPPPAAPSGNIPAAKPAPKDNKPAQPRLNKVYYPVEIMLSPASPRPGSTLLIRARYAAPEVTTVYAEIQRQIIPLRKNGALWQTEYLLPAKGQDLYIKIYARDAQNNLSMTEKLLSF